ncbi:MAG: FAD-dependent oxidoreductase, partial [Firmicutes bacterium]|nr:FAD-dependent oxidoreductase [Bacillota bacterium]
MLNKQYDVIIIGAGPAGIFTALELTDREPAARPLIVDLGRAIENRKCPMRESGKCLGCDPCAIVHGWAGAGAFSDGKLSLSAEVGGHIADYVSPGEAERLIAHADAIYMKFGAPDVVHGRSDTKVDELRYEASRHNIRLVPCPVRHMGTERAG